MKYAELVEKSKDELKTLETELREKLARARFSLADKNLKDLSQIKKLKQDIARILTAVRKDKTKTK